VLADGLEKPGRAVWTDMSDMLEPQRSGILALLLLNDGRMAASFHKHRVLPFRRIGSGSSGRHSEAVVFQERVL